VIGENVGGDQLQVAPEATVNDVIGPISSGADEYPERFYVLSIRKLSILFIATFGLFVLWWCYRNWSTYRARSTDKDLWPATRALFSIFFAHSLNRLVASTLKRRGIPFEWEPNLLASCFVFCVLVANVVGRAADKGIGNPWTDLISLAAYVALLFVLISTQRAINAACRQPDGETNSNFNWANWIWIVVGALVWLLLLVGLLLAPTAGRAG
jgi:hypothetical protein